MIKPEPVKKLDKELKFINFKKNATVSDFWAWAYSDLLQNTTRGVLAEFIVSRLVDSIDVVRKPWDAYDLMLPNGKTIEIKTTSKLQAWSQKELTNPNIVLNKTRFWDANTNKLNDEPNFNADYYVFCYFTAMDHKKANPLDLSQWEFYVLDKIKIEEIFARRKSITIKKLNDMGFLAVAGENLKKEIAKIN